jgi:thymidylate synthase
MNKPIVICENSFQVAWAQAILALTDNHWDAWNIVVQIDHPELFDKYIHNLLENFAKRNNLISQKHVAHTIFPQRFFTNGITRDKLYEKYLRFFKRPRKEPRHGWGTYFVRMISYSTPDGDVDQLGGIINNIKDRSKNYGASYTIVIPCPHQDLNKIMGGPCLNYITIQTENTSGIKDTKIINMLAVYRNHDFTKRAYGNYLGLCHLLKYIAHETNSQIGTLTCVSSHAFIQEYKRPLLEIANTILEMPS